MLAGVILRRAAVLAACAALAAGCTSATHGSGFSSLTPGGSSHPDFPSTSSAAPTTATASAPSTATGSGTGTPTAPLRTVTVHGTNTTYVVKIWADRKDPTCFDHAYGKPVVDFLVKHPCYGLERYLATTTVNGRPVGIALSSLGLPGTTNDPYKYSSEFRQLLEQDNTGSIDDLLREGYRFPGGPKAIPAHEVFNVLGQDNGISVYDVWYLDGTTPDNDPALKQLTQDIFLQI